MASPAPADPGADATPPTTSLAPLATSAPPKIAYAPFITVKPKIHALSVVTKNH